LLPPALSALCGHMEVLVPMAGVIDVQGEITRLDKERNRYRSEISRLDAKLGNSNFIDRAPADVVAKEKEKLTAAQQALTKIDEQIDRLEALR